MLGVRSALTVVTIGPSVPVSTIVIIIVFLMTISTVTCEHDGLAKFETAVHENHVNCGSKASDSFHLKRLFLKVVFKKCD